MLDSNDPAPIPHAPRLLLGSALAVLMWTDATRLRTVSSFSKVTVASLGAWTRRQWHTFPTTRKSMTGLSFRTGLWGNMQLHSCHSDDKGIFGICSVRVNFFIPPMSRHRTSHPWQWAAEAVPSCQAFAKVRRSRCIVGLSSFLLWKSSSRSCIALHDGQGVRGGSGSTACCKWLRHRMFHQCHART